MASTVLEAVETYIELWSERDAAVRAAMLERCFAEDGQIVLPTRELRGRAALAREIETFQADPQVAGIRIVSVIDAQGLTFRFAAALDRRDGTSSEAFDAGLIVRRARVRRVPAVRDLGVRLSGHRVRPVRVRAPRRLQL